MSAAIPFAFPARKQRISGHHQNNHFHHGLLGTDWRFAIAYNSALQSATAALAAAGYRAGHEAHHHRVIESLAFTIGATRQVIGRFDAFRKKRNMSSYEIGGSISEKEAGEMAEFAADLRKQVEEWICRKHPELMP